MKSIKSGSGRSAHIYVLYGLFLLMNMQMLTNMLPLGFRISTVVPNTILILASLPFLLKRKHVNAVDISVYAYIVVSVLSLVLFLDPRSPVDIFAAIYGLNIVVAPAMIYFVARAFSLEDIPKTLSRFLTFNWLLLIAFIVLHVVRPDFYIAYLQNALGALGYVQEWQFFSRLQGYLGSTAVGVLCVVSVFVLGGLKENWPGHGLLLLVFLAAAFLTMQRSSMVMISLGVMWVLYNRPAANTVAALSFGFVASFILAVKAGVDISILDRIVDRVFEIGDVITYSDRTSYWRVWALMEQHPFGMGLGATTSAVDTAGLHPGGQMVDANHIRILADTGLLGLAAFLSSFIVIAVRVLKRPTVFNWSLFLVLFAMQVQATGTNVFDSYYGIHIYWTIMGFLSTSSIPKIATEGSSESASAGLPSGARPILPNGMRPVNVGRTDRDSAAGAA